MGDLSERTTNYKTIQGPCFKPGDIVSPEDWATFINDMTDEGAIALAQLYYEKAEAANGVPVRKDFTFEELVKHGSNMYMAKYNDEGKWETTFCGNTIAESVGFDPTGKTLDDFGTDESLAFWLENFEIMVKECRSNLEFQTLEFANKEYLHCTSFNLPLRSGKTDHPGMCMVYEYFSTETMLPARYR